MCFSTGVSEVVRQLIGHLGVRTPSTSRGPKFYNSCVIMDKTDREYLQGPLSYW